MRQGLALWSFVARRPRLYRRLTGLANRVLALFGRAEGRYRAAAAGRRLDALPRLPGAASRRHVPRAVEEETA